MSAAELRAELLHLGERQAPALPAQPDARGADAETEHDLGLARANRPVVGERERRADGRVAGHRQFLARCEDAHAHRGRRVLRRKDERALRVSHLARDRLHEVGRQTGGLGKDRQLVAAKRAIGEDVEMEVAVGVHGSIVAFFT
jgi:hypothetical protein